MWEVILHPEVEAFVLALPDELYDRVANRFDQLEAHGPHLGRPAVDTIVGSTRHNMKEVRVSTVRILFVFDPARQALLLVAGDKAGRWNQWHPPSIEVAEERYDEWMEKGDWP